MKKRKVPAKLVGGKFVLLEKFDSDTGNGRYRDLSQSLALLKHRERLKERLAKKVTTPPY